MSSLGDVFVDFNDFWANFKERISFAPNNSNDIIFITCRNLFDQFKNRSFLVEEETAIETFMAELSFVCLELQQKQNIYDRVCSSLESNPINKTEAKRIISSFSNWSFDFEKLKSRFLKTGIFTLIF